MSFKVAFIGAGHWIYEGLLRDLLTVPEFKNIEIAFCDINQHNLDMVTELCQRDIQENGLNIQIQPTTDRREALKDAKYVLCTIRVGGLEAFATDVDIPLKYGVDQCVGIHCVQAALCMASAELPRCWKSARIFANRVHRMCCF